MGEGLVFDEDIFAALVAEIGLQDTSDVLTAFLSETRAKVDFFTAGVSDRSLARREAHSLKSSAATLGFMALSDIAREIESGTSQMNDSELKSATVQLCDIFAETSNFAATELLRETAGEIAP